MPINQSPGSNGSNGFVLSKVSLVIDRAGEGKHTAAFCFVVTAVTALTLCCFEKGKHSAKKQNRPGEGDRFFFFFLNEVSYCFTVDFCILWVFMHCVSKIGLAIRLVKTVTCCYQKVFYFHQETKIKGRVSLRPSLILSGWSGEVRHIFTNDEDCFAFGHRGTLEICEVLRLPLCLCLCFIIEHNFSMQRWRHIVKLCNAASTRRRQTLRQRGRARGRVTYQSSWKWFNKQNSRDTYRLEKKVTEMKRRGVVFLIAKTSKLKQRINPFIALLHLLGRHCPLTSAQQPLMIVHRCYHLHTLFALQALQSNLVPNEWQH